ncbi:Tubulin beta-4B chain (Fragments), partial [Aduncisulcus paluster]
MRVSSFILVLAILCVQLTYVLCTAGSATEPIALTSGQTYSVQNASYSGKYFYITLPKYNNDSDMTDAPFFMTLETNVNGGTGSGFAEAYVGIGGSSTDCSSAKNSYISAIRQNNYVEFWPGEFGHIPGTTYCIYVTSTATSASLFVSTEYMLTDSVPQKASYVATLPRSYLYPVNSGGNISFHAVGVPDTITSTDGYTMTASFVSQADGTRTPYESCNGLPPTLPTTENDGELAWTCDLSTENIQMYQLISIEVTVAADVDLEVNVWEHDADTLYAFLLTNADVDTRIPAAADYSLIPYQQANELMMITVSPDETTGEYPDNVCIFTNTTSTNQSNNSMVVYASVTDSTPAPTLDGSRYSGHSGTWMGDDGILCLSQGDYTSAVATAGDSAVIYLAVAPLKTNSYPITDPNIMTDAAQSMVTFNFLFSFTTTELNPAKPVSSFDQSHTYGVSFINTNTPTSIDGSDLVFDYAFSASSGSTATGNFTVQAAATYGSRTVVNGTACTDDNYTKQGLISHSATTGIFNANGFYYITSAFAAAGTDYLQTRAGILYNLTANVPLVFTTTSDDYYMHFSFDPDTDHSGIEVRCVGHHRSLADIMDPHIYVSQQHYMPTPSRYQWHSQATDETTLDITTDFDPTSPFYITFLANYPGTYECLAAPHDNAIQELDEGVSITGQIVKPADLTVSTVADPVTFEYFNSLHSFESKPYTLFNIYVNTNLVDVGSNAGFKVQVSSEPTFTNTSLIIADEYLGYPTGWQTHISTQTPTFSNDLFVQITQAYANWDNVTDNIPFTILGTSYIEIDDTAMRNEVLDYSTFDDPTQPTYYRIEVEDDEDVRITFDTSNFNTASDDPIGMARLCYGVAPVSTDTVQSQCMGKVNMLAGDSAVYTISSDHP